MARKKYYAPAEIKEFRGVTISVLGSGEFSATAGGEHLSADRLVDLEKQIEKQLKKTKVKVEVPITVLGEQYYEPQFGRGLWRAGSGVRRLVLTGVRSDNGNVMARDVVTGEPEQITRIREWVPGHLTDEQAAEYTRLYEANRAAAKALHEFTAALNSSVSEFRLAELVKAAQAAKVDTPEDPEEDPAVADPRLA